jgi:hypothetical protein
MPRDQLRLIKSASALYILHLSSGKAEVFHVRARGASLVDIPAESIQATDISEIAWRSPKTPWVILVDQSEEIFWGGVMPVMRGAARAAWIERMAAQSGTESTYRWSDIQGKSRTQPDKMRVLGYTLGRSEALTPWLEALKSCQVRIRGVYAPVMLTQVALTSLKVKTLKSEDAIDVLITPHAEGSRQTVLVGGRVRFSRLALHPHTSSEQWFETIYRETSRLREYLIGSGLLKNDSTGMRLHGVLPPNASAFDALLKGVQHPRDQYSWIESSLNQLVYVAAVAKRQPATQLAPASYIKRDLSAKVTTAIYASCAMLVAGAVLYLGMGGMQLWQKQLDIDSAASVASRAQQQYQVIAKTYPSSPLTAAQLVELSSRWDAIQSTTSPDMQSVLAVAGQTLERHPGMIIEDIRWMAESPKLVGTQTAGQPPTASKEPKDIATLVMRGTIRGLASNDLRGTRDALSKFLIDLNRNPNIRAEITKQPLDLSTKATLSGSGKQEKSELSFEVKLWQR